MEQGFSDACIALCLEQKPVARVAQTCRAAAIEMPRPTVRKWCETGYNVAYAKTLKDLKTHFVSDSYKADEVPTEVTEQPKTEVTDNRQLNGGISAEDVEKDRGGRNEESRRYDSGYTKRQQHFGPGDPRRAERRGCYCYLLSRTCGR